ncbi:hypothetical protein BDV39DRAFT_181517 [Aspergillus sergii]|uniref:Uncharacterized protein n=1 Tax=Aspergillus sergii TaxID=1034303 RepID=A0A5N6WT18_9EURO|nr:hypothetical protein BDV39DRAFT_181517 [Aspergillus sergii]
MGSKLLWQKSQVGFLRLRSPAGKREMGITVCLRPPSGTRPPQRQLKASYTRLECHLPSERLALRQSVRSKLGRRGWKVKATPLLLSHPGFHTSHFLRSFFYSWVDEQLERTFLILRRVQGQTLAKA